ncbi:hypothetical protein ABFS82_06G082900 [Erythranthe guttata]|uniref:Uncharacterized protein n=1 Tax=Erythranthe guttata TaxID=4155 RepID=A0A022PVL5_ERYGU|nr:PREDICTED: uncharacterized protein LOC105977770 [Erythranthe guttata]EYU19841.1 hypothetical protein MIMGU_mgv1a025503mg [Erythranthe guttata]|eukprot:XP_012858593.1 PREDICTED: uncharacterized protein LOC105977770 [Erythranthe guttata]
MDRDENRKPNKPIYLFPILILFLAVSFTIITRTNLCRIYLLKSTFLHRPNFFQSLSKFLHSNPNPNPIPKQNEIAEPNYCVLWMAPFLSGGGYSSEAWSYILALNSHNKKQKNPFFKLSIDHHGDQENVEFWEGLPQEMRDLAIELHNTECRLNQTVVVCHSEPGGWYPPLFQTHPCPPAGYGLFKVVVGRTMFETDRVNSEHVNRCNKMDYVWVPTDFHVDTFTQSGVDPTKIRKIVQPVDSDFFDPFRVDPMDLDPLGSLVLGSKGSDSRKPFVFLSVFKWEYRKGWDVLLRAYLKEYSSGDDVALYLLTNAYHSENDFSNNIVDFVESSDMEKPSDGWAKIYVIDQHVPQVDLPRLYLAADAFVLPTRGEGWGRPIVEAMAMSLPVIATNWSGPTEYLTEENSYPIPIVGVSEVEQGPFKGHLWAEPCVDQLRILMRRVVMNRDEARAKGAKARLDMVRRFSPEIVAEGIIDHLQGIVDVFH